MTGHGSGLPHPVGASSRLKWPMVGLFGLYVLLAIVLPYMALAWSAFTRSGGSVFAPVWTTANARAVLSSAEVIGATVNTLRGGARHPTFCVALGHLIAYAVRRLRVPGAQALDYITMFSIAVPGIVFGTGVFWTYVLTPVYGTIAVLVLAFLAPICRSPTASAIPLCCRSIGRWRRHQACAGRAARARCRGSRCRWCVRRCCRPG